MEPSSPIDQESARIENIVSEVRPNVCDEDLEGNSPKLQRVLDEHESVLGQQLTFTPGKGD